MLCHGSKSPVHPCLVFPGGLCVNLKIRSDQPQLPVVTLSGPTQVCPTNPGPVGHQLFALVPQTCRTALIYFPLYSTVSREKGSCLVLGPNLALVWVEAG